MVERAQRADARHLALFTAVAAVVIAIDVATKRAAVAYWADQPVNVVGDWFRLTESRNPGAAFGLATNATPILATIAAVAAVALVVAANRARSRFTLATMGLAMGGITGNLVDRVFRAPGVLHGHVVDWISIGPWPNFNLADSALVTACALFIIQSAFDRTPEHEAHKPS